MKWVSAEAALLKVAKVRPISACVSSKHLDYRVINGDHQPSDRQNFGTFTHVKIPSCITDVLKANERFFGSCTLKVLKKPTLCV